MTTWIDLLVERERCILSAADVWGQATNDHNRDNPNFALGVGFRVGKFLDGLIDQYGFATVSSGIMVKKAGRFIVVAQNGVSYSNYVARLVGDRGLEDHKFSFAGDVYEKLESIRGGHGRNIKPLIDGFDVERHTIGGINGHNSRPHFL